MRGEFLFGVSVVLLLGACQQARTADPLDRKTLVEALDQCLDITDADNPVSEFSSSLVYHEEKAGDDKEKDDNDDKKNSQTSSCKKIERDGNVAGVLDGVYFALLKNNDFFSIQLDGFAIGEFAAALDLSETISEPDVSEIDILAQTLPISSGGPLLRAVGEYGDVKFDRLPTLGDGELLWNSRTPPQTDEGEEQDGLIVDGERINLIGIKPFNSRTSYIGYKRVDGGAEN